MNSIPKPVFLTNNAQQTLAVYVFVGEHVAMIDFLRCLQSHLQTGQYMVISVDDENYDPLRTTSLTGRGGCRIYFLCDL